MNSDDVVPWCFSLFFLVLAALTMKNRYPPRVIGGFATLALWVELDALSSASDGVASVHLLLKFTARLVVVGAVVALVLGFREHRLATSEPAKAV